MSDANIASLLASAGCLECLPKDQRQLARIALLANWLPLPARLAGTVAWFAAYRPATVTLNAGRVSRLNDLSGNGHFLTIANPVNSFTLSPGDGTSGGRAFLHNHAVVADPFQTANFGLKQPCTIYLLARVTAQAAPATSYDLFDGLPNLSAAIRQVGQTNTIDLNALGGSQVMITGAWAVFTAIFNGTNSFLQQNRAAGVTGDGGIIDPGGFTLGTRGDGNRVPTMDVMEAIVRTGADSAATINSLQLYLAAKVGLNI